MKTLNQEIFQPLQVYDTLNELPHRSKRYARQRWEAGVNCYVKYADQTVPSKRFLLTPWTFKNDFSFTFTTIKLVNVKTEEEIDITTAISVDEDYSTIDGSYYYRILGHAPIEKTGIKSGYYYLKFVGTFTKYTGEFYIDALNGESADEFENTGQAFNSTVKQLHSSTVTGLLHTGDVTGLYSYDGTSWTKELTVPEAALNSNSIYFADYSGTLYASIGAKIYSRDGAGNWTEIHENTDVIAYTQATVWNGKMYFAGFGGRVDEFDGSTWTELDVPGATLAAMIMFDENQESNNLFLVFRSTIYEYDGTNFSIVANHPATNASLNSNDAGTFLGYGNRGVYNNALSNPGWIIPGYQKIFVLHFFDAQNDWVTIVLKNFITDNYIVRSMNGLSDGSIYFGIEATGGISKIYKLVGDVVTYLKDSPGSIQDMVPHSGSDYLAIANKVYKWTQS